MKRIVRTVLLAIVTALCALVFLSAQDASKQMKESSGVAVDWSKGARKVRALTEHTSWVTSVSYSPDGQYIATGSGDKTAKLWRASDGACVHTLTGHKNNINSVAFSPDGEYALTGSCDNTAKLWSIPDGTCVSTLNLPGNVGDAKFSPDGRYILCGNGNYFDGSAWIKPPEGFVATLFECAG